MMMASTGKYANSIHGRDHATNAREPTKPRTALIGQVYSGGGSEGEAISHQDAMSCLRQADINQLDVCSSAPPPGHERVSTFGQSADNAASLYVSSDLVCVAPQERWSYMQLTGVRSRNDVGAPMIWRTASRLILMDPLMLRQMNAELQMKAIMAYATAIPA